MAFALCEDRCGGRLKHYLRLLTDNWPQARFPQLRSRWTLEGVSFKSIVRTGRWGAPGGNELRDQGALLPIQLRLGYGSTLCAGVAQENVGGGYGDRPTNSPAFP
jgi:hypothetical protein